jgi:hypothetical protein
MQLARLGVTLQRRRRKGLPFVSQNRLPFAAAELALNNEQPQNLSLHA